MSHLYPVSFPYFINAIYHSSVNLLLIVSLIFNAVQLYGWNNVLAIIGCVFSLFLLSHYISMVRLSCSCQTYSLCRTYYQCCTALLCNSVLRLSHLFDECVAYFIYAVQLYGKNNIYCRFGTYWLYVSLNLFSQYSSMVWIIYCGLGTYWLCCSFYQCGASLWWVTVLEWAHVLSDCVVYYIKAIQLYDVILSCINNTYCPCVSRLLLTQYSSMIWDCRNYSLCVAYFMNAVQLYCVTAMQLSNLFAVCRAFCQCATALWYSFFLQLSQLFVQYFICCNKAVQL